MSSPVLSDLARFHASSSALQVSNTAIWNKVQSAVIKVFQGRTLQTNELYTLNESVRWLLKTEMGSFIPEYFQNQLLTRGLSGVLEQILSQCKDPGDQELLVLTEVWDQFFTETLPTLQAIFYPLQGQELTVRQMALLAFRDVVLVKLPLEDTLGSAASVPPSFIQMLLVLQGVHDCGSPSLEYYQLERLVEVVVSPYLCNIIPNSSDKLRLESCHSRLSSSLLADHSHPEITVSEHRSASESTSLSPLEEKEGEAYLEKGGGVRRHTVANDPSDAHLLLLSNRMHAGIEGGGSGSSRAFSSQPDMMEAPSGSTENGQVKQG